MLVWGRTRIHIMYVCMYVCVCMSPIAVEREGAPRSGYLQLADSEPPSETMTMTMTMMMTRRRQVCESSLVQHSHPAAALPWPSLTLLLAQVPLPLPRPLSRSASLSLSLDEEDEEDEEDENLYDDGDELDLQEITSHSYQRSDSLRGLLMPMPGPGQGPGPVRRSLSQQSVRRCEGEHPDPDLEGGGRFPPRVRPAAVVVNCQHLLGLDASAIDVLEQVAGRCRQGGCSLIFASVRRAHYRILKRTALFDSNLPMTAAGLRRDRDRGRGRGRPTVGFTTGLDEALQIVEDRLLEEVDQDQRGRGQDGHPPPPDHLPLPPGAEGCSSSSSSCIQDFHRCLQIIQQKLSVTIDVEDIMQLAADCIPFHFKRGQPIQVRVADLVGRKPAAPAPAPSPLSCADLTDSPASSGGNSPSIQSRHLGAGAGRAGAEPGAGQTYSKKALCKNVRGLFFLYKGYVTCRDRPSHDDDDDEEEDDRAADPRGGRVGRPFEKTSLLFSSSSSWWSFLARRGSIDAQIRRLELSRSSGGGGTGTGDRTRGSSSSSQHGPGWVFGRLREGVEHGAVETSCYCHCFSSPWPVCTCMYVYVCMYVCAESKHAKGAGLSQDRAALALGGEERPAAGGQTLLRPVRARGRLLPAHGRHTRGRQGTVPPLFILQRRYYTHSIR